MTGGPNSGKLARYKDFADELAVLLRQRPRTLWLGGDLHFNAINDRGGFIEPMTSGVAQVRRIDKEPLDNWALLEIGQQAVDVVFHGSPAEVAGRERHRLHITPDWKIAQ
jgi:hypothetical protein